MKLFAVSGLGADKRVFTYLELNYELIPVDWIEPLEKEPIVDYTKRLIKKYGIGKEPNFGVVGVSFGGLIATEISKLTAPKCTILISSVATKYELSRIIKLAGKSNLLEVIPEKLLNPPKLIAHFIFGAKNKQVLNAILADTDLSFTKWALRELINWNNTTLLSNLIKIGGTKDKLLPPKGENVFLIEKGAHFMIVDKAKEISSIINTQIKNYYT